MAPTFLLFCALAALAVALILIWAGRFNAACNRNVDSAWADKLAELHAASARLGASINRLEAWNARAIRAELKAERSIIGLPVRTATNPKPAGQVQTRRSPPVPTPPPDGKKKPTKRK